MSKIVHSKFAPGKEGVFDIPSELYHNHSLCPEVNRGLVAAMATSCPAVVKSIIDGSAKKKTTKAMEAGLLVDLAILEPHKFKEGLSHWVAPEGMSFNTAEGRAWKKDHPNLPIIKASNDSMDEASAEDIQGMIESVMRHKIARRIVERSHKQESAFSIDKDTGILKKCRADARLEDNSGRLTISDLKSTGLGGTKVSKFSTHCARMNYHLQDAFYSGIYEELTGEAPYFVFVVVERKPPYLVRVFQVDNEGKASARDEYKKALEKYAQCKASGVWPDYPEQVEIIKLPKWKIQTGE